MISNFDGITENNKPSSKVLRPPGGGSSDIFGADMPQTPRSVKNHMQSNIFSSDKNASVKNNGDQPRRAQKNVDSYSRLFGEPDRPVTPTRYNVKSNIPFGAKTEAAQQLLANGNGHHHTTNGKSGSVSSASSSVSSSTENLKMMNGISKTAVDEACAKPSTPPYHRAVSAENEANRNRNNESSLQMDINCVETKKCSNSAQSPNQLVDKIDVGTGDIASQTRRDSSSSPENPHSLTKMSCSSGRKAAPLDSCIQKPSKETPHRNPITGLGLCGDGVGGIKPMIPKNRRDGNPVTGEGYKPGHETNNSVPSLNGANQIINKNRIPPGGFSSGLW